LTPPLGNSRGGVSVFRARLSPERDRWSVAETSTLMTLPTTATDNTPAAAGPAQRPVLVWNPDNDESHVKASSAEAAGFLKVDEAQILEAISAGSLVGGWFVDWAAAGQ
jgi:hypothetical protein